MNPAANHCPLPYLPFGALRLTRFAGFPGLYWFACGIDRAFSTLEVVVSRKSVDDSHCEISRADCSIDDSRGADLERWRNSVTAVPRMIKAALATTTRQSFATWHGRLPRLAADCHVRSNEGACRSSSCFSL